jgi:hypothetical protein
MKFNDLTQTAQENAIRIWMKYNNTSKRSESQVRELLLSKNWEYKANGEMNFAIV